MTNGTKRAGRALHSRWYIHVYIIRRTWNGICVALFNPVLIRFIGYFCRWRNNFNSFRRQECKVLSVIIVPILRAKLNWLLCFVWEVWYDKKSWYWCVSLGLQYKSVVIHDPFLWYIDLRIEVPYYFSPSKIVLIRVMNDISLKCLPLQFRK